jgi:hypothetical protein
MNEAEGFDFSVNNLASEKLDQTRRRSVNRLDNPTLGDIIEFIKNKNLSSEFEEKLIKIAKNTPHGSLSTFRKNYKLYLRKK